MFVSRYRTQSTVHAAIAILFLLFSCTSPRKSSSVADVPSITTAEESKPALTNETYPVRISGDTRRFLNDLKQEGGDQQPFVPSPPFIRKYGLIKNGDFYYIRGMIKTRDGFDSGVLEKTGAIAGPPAGNILTIMVPINRISTFLQQETIEYFEISGKAVPH